MPAPRHDEFETRLGLSFRDRFVRELPGDPSIENVPRQVKGAAWSPVLPTKVAAPRVLLHSREVADELGLSESVMRSPEMAEVLSGNRMLRGMRPYAACYGGHQFGSWAGQLGDGRAITLGEIATPSGKIQEIQLKGAGPTPYSRRADGRAVLRSSVREMLCSEAMHHLGVPTTRALALTATGESVVRDMLYDGNPKAEPGAVVARVAPSFVRFGNFELPTARKDEELLRALTAHVMKHHYPELVKAGDPTSPDSVAAFLIEVAERTARMIAEWMRVGFVHGVMNTDNMSILGLTIDYGPYGWLEGYDPGWTPNTTDAQGRRYRYGAQPSIGAWNVARLADALAPLLPEGAGDQAMKAYGTTWEERELRMYAEKLGLRAVHLPEEGEGGPSDMPLLEGLFGLFGKAEIDMPLFYRALADVPTHEPLAPEAWANVAGEVLGHTFYDTEVERVLRPTVGAWLSTYAARVREDGRDPEERRASMRRANPKYVLRNWLAQKAIDLAEAGDTSELEALLEVLRRPYDDQPGREAYAQKRPEWARHKAGCSMLSCSS